MTFQVLVYLLVALEMAIMICSDFSHAYDMEEKHPIFHILSAIVEVFIFSFALVEMVKVLGV